MLLSEVESNNTLLIFLYKQHKHTKYFFFECFGVGKSASDVAGVSSRLNCASGSSCSNNQFSVNNRGHVRVGWGPGDTEKS